MVVQQLRPIFTAFISVGVLLLCLLLPNTLFAKVSAHVDRTTLYQGDRVTLTIESEDQDGEPDFSPLQADFRTGGTSQSQQISIINGRYSNKTSWQIELEPLRANNVIIPSIRVGNEQTQPILLTIKQQTPQEQAQTANDIFILVKAETGGHPPFVQQQIRYSVRLLFRLPLLEGELSTPVVENAIIEQLGDSERSRTIYNGSEYQVIERHYAIFPEKSGELTLPPIHFQGRVSINRAQTGRPQSARDRFFQDNFFNSRRSAQSSRPVRIQSQEITLQVQPQPAQYSGQHWLPSAQLTLKDSWAHTPPEFRAGQPVSRTLTIEAKGLAASHIPQLSLDAPNHLRIYPEPAEIESATDGIWVYGQSQQRFTYIPSKPGRQSLPAISLTWWNITTGKQEMATLPAWQIDVLPPLEGATHQSTIEPTEPSIETKESTETINQPNEGSLKGLYLFALTALTLFILFIARYLLKHEAFRQKFLANRGGMNRESVILKDLQRACANNQPAAAKKALLQLAAETWPDQCVIGLNTIAKRFKEGERELAALDQVLYAPKGQPWNGAKLWTIFQHGLVAKKESGTHKKQVFLAPLYPTS